jgi:TRAP-type uncharacterized transport system fused permease subunit
MGRGNLLIASCSIALASLVLGMGLPVTAAYIVLGTLSAPALYQLILQGQLVDLPGRWHSFPETAKRSSCSPRPIKMAALAAPMPVAEAQALVAPAAGTCRCSTTRPSIRRCSPLALLSAHMIIFWLSQDSNVTPPVCLAAFTGAAIAGSPPMKTGFAAWKVAKGLYLVPLLFAYTPFLSGDWPHAAHGFAVLGFWAVAAGIFALCRCSRFAASCLSGLRRSRSTFPRLRFSLFCSPGTSKDRLKRLKQDLALDPESVSKPAASGCGIPHVSSEA